MLRHAIHKFLRTRGYDVRRLRDWPFGAIWTDDLAFLKPRTDIQVIIDIGAHTGETAESALEAFPAAKIYSFEPVSSSFELLDRKFRNHARVECVPLAISDSHGEVTMTARNAHSTNRIVNDDSPRDETAEVIKVRTETLDRFCAQRGIAQIDLLKIDTEGHELQVLQGATGMLQGKVEFILAECEFQPKSGVPPLGSFTEMLNFLSPLSFRIVSFYSGRIDHQGWVFGDVLLKCCKPDDPVRRASCSPWRKGVSGDC